MSQTYKGRTEPCNNDIGGIKNVYLWKWEQYAQTEIKGVRGSSLTSYPATVVYQFETLSDGNTYEDSLIEDNAYEQSLSVTLKKADLESNIDLQSYQNIILGVIVEGYNGIFRLMGASNGVELENISTAIGSGKSDFNGYNLTLTGRERFKAPLFTNLNEVGFGIDTGSNYLISELFEILTDENNNRLIYA